jgi:hypothetical protein
MLIEVDKLKYSNYFPSGSNPFISEEFIELNSKKVDKVVRLIEENQNPTLGLKAGIKNGVLQSPFSAPFGGFDNRKENIYISEIDNFIGSLQSYLVQGDYTRMELIIPPDIYHPTLNAKLINSLIRHSFRWSVPEITNWVDLQKFDGYFRQKNSREYYRQALRKGLSFSQADSKDDKIAVYNLIRQNRTGHGRPIYMTFQDIIDTANLWIVDFFKVVTVDNEIVASAVFYRSHPEICYAVFWGDSDAGRPMRSMDFLIMNLYSFYKQLGYKYLDLGISTESGSPNEGLLRFKESHEAVSSLRYKFIWEVLKS